MRESQVEMREKDFFLRRVGVFGWSINGRGGGGGGVEEVVGKPQERCSGGVGGCELNAVAGSEKQRSSGGRVEWVGEREVFEAMAAWAGRLGETAVMFVSGP